MKNGKVDLKMKHLIYLSAEEEEKKIIAQANATLMKDGKFADTKVKARFHGDYPIVEPEEG